jgi:hypothetical protein
VSGEQNGARADIPSIIILSGFKWIDADLQEVATGYNWIKADFIRFAGSRTIRFWSSGIRSANVRRGLQGCSMLAFMAAFLSCPKDTIACFVKGSG